MATASVELQKRDNIYNDIKESQLMITDHGHLGPNTNIENRLKPKATYTLKLEVSNIIIQKNSKSKS
jgi:hypothetical protein